MSLRAGDDPTTNALPKSIELVQIAYSAGHAHSPLERRVPIVLRRGVGVGNFVRWR
jgi:hypothetical protein